MSLRAKVNDWLDGLVRVHPAWAPVVRLFKRFVRFGIVGASGIVVNQLMLWLGMEWLFVQMAKPQRLSFALGVAIGMATVYNFSINRLWTWRERRSKHAGYMALQFVSYVTATAIGSSVQFFLTRQLASDEWGLHYQIANLIAIALVSFINFALNDRVTFRRRR